MPRRKQTSPEHKSSVTAGAIAAEEIHGEFPALKLPIQPPFAPMEAKLVESIPDSGGYQYEPKWDGFRCLVFRDNDQVVLQSKSGQPLGRYFPEVVKAVQQLGPQRFVLDGEIVILLGGRIAFDELLQRIHPAKSRIERLSKETPATLLCFDILLDAQERVLLDTPQRERRKHLEEFFLGLGSSSGTRIRLSPATYDLETARLWMEKLASEGLEGIVAKQADIGYRSGERAMLKVKRIRSADCVVGGFRRSSKGTGVGSLLLGLYGGDGLLHHVGFTSSFNAAQRQELLGVLKPYFGGEGFTGRAPGGPSRWSTERSGEWEPLDPKLVCEVMFDHFSGERFRHGTKFLRWRPEKTPEACTFEQVNAKSSRRGIEGLLAA